MSAANYLLVECCILVIPVKSHRLFGALTSQEEEDITGAVDIVERERENVGWKAPECNSMTMLNVQMKR